MIDVPVLKEKLSVEPKMLIGVDDKLHPDPAFDEERWNAPIVKGGNYTKDDRFGLSVLLAFCATLVFGSALKTNK